MLIFSIDFGVKDTKIYSQVKQTNTPDIIGLKRTRVHEVSC